MRSSKEARVALRNCFRFADREQKGYLNLRDLKCGVAAALGIRASKLMLTQIFRGFIPDNGHGGISAVQVPVDTFVEVLLARMQQTDLLEDIRRAFKAMDLRAQGFITLESFETACALVLPRISKQILLSAFHEADRDGDGRVTYQDFEKMYLLAVELDNSQSKSTK